MAATSLWLDEGFDLADLLTPPGWMRDALCVEHREIEFFVERGGTTAPAKAVCERCAVRDECLEFALAQGIEWGIWGALSPQERKAARRRAAA